MTHLGHPGQINVLADESPEHLEHAFHILVQIKNHGNVCLLPSKGQQLPGYGRGMFYGLDDLLKVGMQRLVRIHFAKSPFRITEDHGEHIVVIVGHASCQLANRFHLLSLLKLGRQSYSGHLLFQLCFLQQRNSPA